MNQEPYIFQEGDVVSFGGIEGVVKNLNGNYPFSVSVLFNSGATNIFTKEGLFYPYHTEPVLKLIRPANKPKRKLQMWMHWYKNTETDDINVDFSMDPPCVILGLDHIKSTLLEEFEI